MVASDGGDPSLNTSLLIAATILDSNDNDPEFVDFISPLNISENANKTTALFTVKAIDKDKDENAAIRYSITSTDSEVGYFDINSQTGDVTLNEMLDWETIKTHKITIEATDQGNPPRKISEEMVINVLDENDNEATFTDRSPQTLSIPEQPPVFNIAVVREAEDLDSEENSINFYYLAGGNGYGFFSVDQLSRNLSIIKELDREVNDNYELVIQVSEDDSLQPDGTTDWFGVQNNGAYMRVLVTVTDVNDNVPVFDEDGYRGDLGTDAQPNDGVVITTVHATDVDIDDTISYLITQGQYRDPDAVLTTENEQKFDIDPSSGEITLIKAISGINGGEYILTVNATDGLFSASTTVIITVISDEYRLTYYSTIPPDEFDRDAFSLELSKLLGNDSVVVVDKVEPHISPDDSSVKCKVTFHVISEDEAGNDEFATQTQVDSVLSDSSSNNFVNDFGLQSNTDTTVVEEVGISIENAIILISIIAVLALVLIGVIIAFSCVRSSYKRKSAVQKASDKAMGVVNGPSQGAALPNTNIYEGENPLFGENQFSAINIGFVDATEDDDLDENEVDAAYNEYQNNQNANKDDDDENDYDVDFPTSTDLVHNANLVAALNQANKGGGNLTTIFDQDDQDASGF